MIKSYGNRAVAWAAWALLCAGNALPQQYTISTVAGGAPTPTPAFAVTDPIGMPRALTVDSAGNVYFTSLNSVFRLYPNGALTRVAGNSRAGYAGDGGPAVNAQLSAPAGLAVDSAGDIFIADSGNNRVREIFANGIINTVAGTGAQGFAGDGGPAVNAQLSSVLGVTLDASGNLYIADSGNNRVRKVGTDGIVATIAGNGNAAYAGDGGSALAAQLSATSIALDGLGNLFIGDSVNYRVREISAAGGTIMTVAGAGTPGYSGDGHTAIGAQLSAFRGIAVDQFGHLYIADTGNSCIREVVSGSGVITTVAGIGQNAFFGDNGPAAIAALSFPSAVALDSSGDYFIADTSNYRVRVVTNSGTISTIAGNGTVSYSGDGGPAVDAQLYSPHGLALDLSGDLFIADTSNNLIREVLTTGIIGTVAGNGTPGFSGDGGSPTGAALSSPQSLAVDGVGELFIADTGNYRVREVSGGTLATIAGAGNSVFTVDGGPALTASLSTASVALDKSGNLFIGDPVNFRIRVVSTAGNIATVAGNGTKGYSGDNGPAVNAQLAAVAGVAIDSAGNLYIADAGNHCIREVSTTGIITTVAGNGTPGFSGDGKPATGAQLNNPSAIALDTAGNLFIADTGNNRIRRVSTSGVITTVAGTGSPAYTGDGGLAVSAGLSNPYGVAIGKSGAVYVADTGNNAVRLLTPANQSVLITSVVDAASETAVPLSAGKIVVIYGNGLGPAQLAVNAPDNKGFFSQQLAGTTVSFRGVSAPIYYTSATQVAAIVPYEISGSASVPVEVGYQGQISSPFTVPFAAAAPSFFTSNATGAGEAAAINDVDGTLNSATNPIKIGGYISFYATGEGQTSPAGVDGRLGTLTSAIPVLPVTATVGGLPAIVQYKGGVYGVVAGLMQVNVQIPTGVTPGGYVPIVLTVGSASTVSGAIWIAVSN